MKKLSASFVLVVAFTTAHAGTMRVNEKVEELRALNELPTSCPSIKVPKVVADYRARANGGNFQQFPGEEKAVGSFIKECWMQAVIDKQNKK